MKTREKAKELYWKYYQNISDTSYPEETAKQCALIAVDEIDNIYQKLTPDNDPYCYLHQLEYWQEVKQELQKL
jgi:hypothetical protein